MPPFTPLLALWSFLILPILAQDDPGHDHQLANFRYDCSTPELDGTILTAPCEELCSACLKYYISSIDLNKCVGYDGGDSLVPQLDGNYGNACKNCYTNWHEPDILHCSCQGNDGQMHDVSMDMNTAVGTRCGRLSCLGFTNNLGSPMVLPDKENCGIQSDDPSGLREVAKPTHAPDLLYIRRGMVHRQFPQTNTTSTSTSTTASVLITLTPHPFVPGGAANTATSIASAALPESTVAKGDSDQDQD
ncbi:hypothetical protein GE09DRAFT_1230990 [Coniochaeta sp. 2T2.1]|nr:hypothetical protein GE09DRAFT_1230990 [Coniochaeta sp. 2T2.1]